MEFWSNGVMETWKRPEDFPTSKKKVEGREQRRVVRDEKLEFWSFGVLEEWSSGVMEFWSDGDLETSGGLSNVKKEGREQR